MTVSKYYNYDRAWSFNRLFTLIVSSKGVGKSYGMKKKVFAYYKKTGRKFVYVRRTGQQIKEIKRNKGDGFLLDIRKAFPNDTLEMRGNEFLFNGEVCGTALSVTKAGTYTGTTWDDVDYIWFDEFISKGTADDRYQGGGVAEVESFLLICDTIIRNRTDVRVIMNANNHTIVNPYFDYFGLNPKIGERFTVRKNLLLDMYDAMDFAEERTKTPFGEFIRGVAYGTFALDNQSLIDNESYIRERTSRSIPLFNVYHEREYMTFYADDYTGLYFFTKAVNTKNNNTFVFNERDMSEHNMYARNWRSYKQIELIKAAFDNKLIYYDTQKCKQLAFSIYKKIAIL